MGHYKAPPARERHYVVIVLSSWQPVARFENELQAIAEAERLARLNPGTWYRVMHEIGIICSHRNHLLRSLIVTTRF